MTAVLEGVSGQQHVPAALYPRERPGTHFTGDRVGPRAVLEGQKISSPPGIRPRTVQPVVSRYTDWATRPTFKGVVFKNRIEYLFSIHCLSLTGISPKQMKSTDL